MYCTTTLFVVCVCFGADIPVSVDGLMQCGLFPPPLINQQYVSSSFPLIVIQPYYYKIDKADTPSMFISDPFISDRFALS